MKCSRISRSVHLSIVMISVLLTVCLGFSTIASADMKSGQKAIDWLIKHKYIDPVTHIPMHNFYVYRSGVLGDSSFGPHGLKAILAEGWTFTGPMTQPIKNPVIVVDNKFSVKGSIITVVSATYGWNCRTYTPKNGTANTVHKGNATTWIKRLCDGRNSCRYSIDFKTIGDPVYGCVKDYIVEWRCSGNPAIKTNRVTPPPDAGLGRIAILTCP